ncbi:MAG: hypothetical protein PVF83_01630 [Anaerolineales bacterium]|jgi:hypothetical protein
MQQFGNLLLSLACILLPFIVIIFVIVSYSLGTGGLKIRGIARGKTDTKKHWSNATSVSESVGQVLASVTVLLGTLLALTGFLLPWLEINLSGGMEIFDLLGDVVSGEFSGSTSGLTLMLMLFVAGYNIIGDSIGTGLILLVLGLILLIVLVGLILSLLVGIGKISIHLGFTEGNQQRFSRPSLLLTLFGLVFSCIFIGVVQGTLGGIQLGGSSPMGGFEGGVQVVSGYWFTVIGFFLALVGAVTSNKLAPRFSSWIEKISSLTLDD